MPERLSDEAELEIVQGVLEKISANVSMLVDRDIRVGEVSTSHVTERPVGKDVVHISFKLGLSNSAGESGQGCLLIPLPDALSLACYLMMFSEGDVQLQREKQELDESSKDAILELGNFIGAAVDEVLRLQEDGLAARMQGCQGVRSDVRPALDYTEGSELLVGRAPVQIHEFPEFEMILMVPPLPLGAA